MNDLILIRVFEESKNKKLIVATTLAKFLNLCEKRNKPIFMRRKE